MMTIIAIAPLADSEQAPLGGSAKLLAFLSRAQQEGKMPVLIMRAIPAVILVGGVGYYLVSAVH